MLVSKHMYLTYPPLGPTPRNSCSPANGGLTVNCEGEENENPQT
jgi:hypothetical protein